MADIEKSYRWLEKAGLKDSTEALFMADQEQALTSNPCQFPPHQTEPQVQAVQRDEKEEVEKCGM